MKERKAYAKAYKQAHKEQRKAYYEANKEEIKASKKAYYQAHKDQAKAYAKVQYQSQKEEVKAANKAYYEANKEEIKASKKAYRQAHKEHYNAYMKDYNKADVNSHGQTKNSIRVKSLHILKRMNLHIDGYEIHHCFGYEDPSKFIYISKSLHLKIHQFLRDNNIDVDSNHWLRIRDMVLHCNEYFYAKF